MKKRLMGLSLLISLFVPTNSLLQGCITHYGEDAKDSIQFCIYPPERNDDRLECDLDNSDIDNQIYLKLYEKQSRQQ